MGVGFCFWLASNWLRMKHGYPLDGAWGQALHPKTDREAADRMRLLTEENAKLRADLGSVTKRLHTLERIVTDQPDRVARAIEQLR
jgi:hypothetical protein